MANYSLVVNSKFQPFSFERYIQPYAIYGQNYKELEEQYADLSTKANVWDKLANEQTDTKAYAMYKTYANDLASKAEQLAREGLNATSRREMLDIRSRYSKEITPLENAYKARAEEIKEQTAGRANGMVYEGNAATSSLDRYLDNPSIKYNGANSKEGFQRVYTAASALQKKLREYGRGKSLDGFIKTWLQEHGYRDNEVYQAINDIQGALQGDGNVRGNNVLTSILADEMNTSGVNLWKDKNAKLDYFNRIAPALYQAVGQTNVGTYEDKAAIMAEQEAMQIRAERREAARKALEQKQALDGAVTHWEGTLDDKNSQEYKTYASLLADLTVKGRGLSKKYTADRNGRFINPMKVYEEALAYAKRHPKKESITMNTSAGAYSKTVDVSMPNAIKVIEKKYGTKVIPQNYYNGLKGLGYSGESTFGEMNGTNISNRINKLAKMYRATSTNMGSYDDVGNTILSNIASWGDDNDGKIYEIKNGKKGKEIDISDILQLDNGKLKSDNKVQDIAYSMLEPTMIAMVINNKRVFVSPYAHSSEAANIVNDYNEMIKATNSDEKKSILQDLATSKLRELFNSYDPVRSTSSSKR